MVQQKPVVDIHQITTVWVETCLRRHFPLLSGAVTKVRVAESFSSCSALNTRLEVDYTPEAAGIAPRHLMLRSSGGQERLNRREVQFYNELAPRLPTTPTVPCYDIAWSEAPLSWHVLLLDVSPTHDHGPQPLNTTQRRFLMPAHGGNVTTPEPYENATYQAIAEAFASLHARFWDNELINEPRHATSPGGPHCVAAAPSPDEILSIADQRREVSFPRYRDEWPNDPSASEWSLCEQALGAWPRLISPRAVGGNLTLVQSDSHLGNILIDRDPSSSHVYLLDWDAYQRGIGPWDIACLLILSHAPDIRRVVERRMLETYHRALLNYGVTGYSFEECVADYRLAAYVCPFVPIAWRRPEFVSYALAAFEDWHCADLLSSPDARQATTPEYWNTR